MNLKLTLAAMSLYSTITSSQGHEFCTTCPEGHGPISVMGDHMHKSGETMFSYRFMTMDMDGMRSGTNGVSSDEVFAANYTVTPTSMTMDMHMFGIMHAPNDKVTLMGMLPYTESEMDHLIFGMAAPLIALNDDSRIFTTRSSGWGDFKLSALVDLFKQDNQRAHYTIGLSAPTGSIDEQDIIPGPGGRILRQMPAPMQTSSGTWDLLAGLTYLLQTEGMSYGAQASAKIRLEDENDNGYRLGNEITLLAWAARNINKNISLSSKIEYNRKGSLHGQQAGISLNPPFAPSRMTVPTAFSTNYGGDRADLGLGLNYIFTEGPLTDNRLALELEYPLYQDLNGYQLETDLTVTAGWQLAW
ncbi:MAG: transporter [Verrucomicrobiota bacterium]